MAHSNTSQWRAAIPKEPSTRSFWHNQLDTTLPDRSQEILPQAADFVVIGSGLSGSLIAYDLQRSSPPGTSVVVLEARFAVSGATGRNGGHIKPGRIHSFDHWKRTYGVETAIKQAALEKANYEDTVRFIQEHGLVDEVNLVLLRAVDACMNEESLEKLKSCWEDLQSAGVDMSDMKFHEGPSAARDFRVPQCLAGVSYPAASLWPYKLAIATLRKAEDLGARLYTHTPVELISRSDPSQPWTVRTPKGIITAKKVVHATNGYASSLLPELTDKLAPVKGHAAAFKPPANYYDTPLPTSFAFHWGEDFDYLIQRHHGSKELVVGGCDLTSSGNPAIGVGDSDDSFLYQNHVKSLRKFPGETFESWTKSGEHGQSENVQIWSGIMGFVVDDFPYVGEVPGKPDQFICAGYSGSGMARAFLCTQALCQLIRGEQVDDRIPSVYFDLERRWATKERASVKFGAVGSDQARL